MIKDINWIATSIRKSGRMLRAPSLFESLRFKVNYEFDMGFCALYAMGSMVVIFRIITRFEER